MEIILISIASFLASFITLFSGFGLGTILTPVIAIFLPINIAVAVTAIVHLLNNLFKLLLLYKNINYKIVVFFGFPAFLAALIGAYLLNHLSQIQEIYKLNLFAFSFEISPLKFIIGILLIFFASAEIFPFLQKICSKINIIYGGILSGFFGGLSGHQGAFRSAFLIKANLDKNAFVATNATIASLVDISRIIIYGIAFNLSLVKANQQLIIISTLAGFIGVFLGTKFLKKITFKFVQVIVAIMLYLLALLLIFGII